MENSFKKYLGSGSTHCCLLGRGLPSLDWGGVRVALGKTFIYF